MKIIIHKQDDALYLRLNESPIFESEQVRDGIVIDYDTEGQVVGIEVLYVSQRSPQTLEQILVETPN
ncbi:MAG: DUF2283 domain-containing protein [Gloeomargarita sp. DG_2_bins_126]